MTTVIRYDAAELKAREDGDGFLYDSPVVARTGIMVYRNADGTVRRELRTREDASQAAFLESMVGKPIIITHSVGMVSKHTAKGNVVGTMLASRQDGIRTISDIVIHDGEAIKLAKQGVARALSLGYRLELEKRAGYYNADSDEISDVPRPGFEPFDAIQRNLRVNHLALVRRARAGDVARLNLDGDEIINDLGENLMKIKLPNGVEVEVSEDVGNAYNEQSTRLDGVNAELSTTRGTLAAVTADRDQLKQDVANFDTRLKQARTDAAEELRQTDALVKSVAHKVTDVEGKSDVEIKSAFLKATMPALNLDGMDDSAIDGAFTVALASHPAQKENGQRKTATGQRGDSADGEGDGKTAAQVAQEKYRQRLMANKVNAGN